MDILNRINAQTKPFYSLEFFPPKEKDKWADFFAMVEKLKAINPLFASVTCGAGGSVEENTVEIAGIIKNIYGIECMAHCTCVRSTQKTMQNYLDALDRANIHNILALRGDKPKNKDGIIDESLMSHDFKYASDLVQYAKKEKPHFGVAVAAYPAPHPESKSFSDDRKFLLQKIRSGADFAVTQLFFDNREYFDLLEIVEREGLKTKIIPAILPIISLANLKHILSLCGANIPAKYFITLEEAHEKGGTEKVREVSLQFAAKQIKELLAAGAPGIHLYTLNKAELCLNLVDMI